VRGAPLSSTTNGPSRIDSRCRGISPSGEDFTLLGEETMFGGVGGELDGPVVGRDRLGGTPGPGEQVGSGRVVGLIGVDRVVVHGVENGDCDVGAAVLGDSDGAVDGDDRVRSQAWRWS
jgi:hypothetical protein